MACVSNGSCFHPRLEFQDKTVYCPECWLKDISEKEDVSLRHSVWQIVTQATEFLTLLTTAFITLEWRTQREGLWSWCTWCVWSCSCSSSLIPLDVVVVILLFICKLSSSLSVINSCPGSKIRNTRVQQDSNTNTASYDFYTHFPVKGSLDADWWGYMVNVEWTMTVECWLQPTFRCCFSHAGSRSPSLSHSSSCSMYCPWSP